MTEGEIIAQLERISTILALIGETVNHTEFAIQELDLAINAFKVDVKAMRDEIENNMEEVVGTYDASTPEHNKPLQKSARNEARRECLAIIDKYMGVKK